MAALISHDVRKNTARECRLKFTVNPRMSWGNYPSEGGTPAAHSIKGLGCRSMQQGHKFGVLTGARFLVFEEELHLVRGPACYA